MCTFQKSSHPWVSWNSPNTHGLCGGVPGGGEYRDVSLYDYSGLNTGAPVQYTDVHGRSVYMTSAPPHVLRSPRGGTAAPLHTRTYVTPSGGGDGPAISSGHLASHLLGGGGAPLTGSYVTSNNGQPMLFSVPADGIMGPASPGGMSGSMPAGAERGGTLRCYRENKVLCVWRRANTNDLGYRVC